MKTETISKKQIKQDWHLFDAKDFVLGRLSTKVASILMGKEKTTYSPNLVSGDKVVIINSDKIQVTGKKLSDKLYRRHSGYGGGFKERNLEYFMKKDSTFVIKEAVSGMLPKNKLRDKLMLNLYVYKGEEHPHAGQVK